MDCLRRFKMEILKELTDKLCNAINYLYCVGSEFTKNSYPFKFIGEKITTDSADPVIIYKIVGNKYEHQTSLNSIFGNKIIISGFSPKDAVRLGIIAFNHIISKEKMDIKKFSAIKEIMLTST